LDQALPPHFLFNLLNNIPVKENFSAEIFTFFSIAMQT